MKTIKKIEELELLKQKEKIVLVYFSHEKCNVCKVLKPKIANMLKEKYSKVKMYYSDTEKTPEIAGQNSVFTVPTILVFIEGSEYIRKSRNISLAELADAIERPYNMIF